MQERDGKFFTLCLFVETNTTRRRNWYSLGTYERQEARNVFQKALKERKDQLMMEINRRTCDEKYKNRQYPIIIEILGTSNINHRRGSVTVRARKHCFKNGLYNHQDNSVMRSEIIKEALNTVFGDLTIKCNGQTAKLLTEPSLYHRDLVIF